MITMAGRGTRKHLRQAMEILDQVDAPVGGLVLNGVEVDRQTYYEGSYSYYGQAAQPPPSQRRPVKDQVRRQASPAPAATPRPSPPSPPPPSRPASTPPLRPAAPANARPPGSTGDGANGRVERSPKPAASPKPTPKP